MKNIIKELRVGNYIHHNPDNKPFLDTYLTVYELGKLGNRFFDTVLFIIAIVLIIFISLIV